MLYIALAQGRAEDATDIGPENLRIGGPLDGHAGGGTIQAHRADHGGGMPMTLGAAGEHFKTGATQPSSHFSYPVRFAFPDTSEQRSPGVGH
jgi:hypothetical protein